MEIQLITVGRTRIPYVAAGIADYAGRLRRYVPFAAVELPDVRTAKSMPEARQKEMEGEMILHKILPADFVVLLDEKGREYSSVEFSKYIEKLMLSGRKRVNFVVGGPYGFAQRVYDRADAMLSLSRMTLNHEMVRMFFIEQLYRAQTILRGEPYHHA